MAPITDTTFDPLRRFVNVRLQQGVPIVDADWNELDDVRKFELRAFLKWYVGDGVPEGNDGFRVTAAAAPNRVGNVLMRVGAQGPAPAGTGGETVALRHAGRAVVDGLDVMIEADLPFLGQELTAGSPTAAAAAARLGVPQIAAMPASGQVLVYLDVWEWLIRPDTQPALVLPGLGVESCARMRREWVVRARAGRAVPVPGEGDFLPSHAYLPLAVVVRRGAATEVTDNDIVDVRQRRLLTLPAHLLTDTLGVAPAAYRRGEGRPPISLREAVNALLSGELPATAEMAVSPDPRPDVGRRAVVLAAGSLVTAWTSPRVGNTNQILTARLDLADIAPGFTSAVVTTGSQHLLPTAAALPGGDVVLAYQTGPTGAATTDVVMRRAAFGGLTAAVERPVFDTGSADERPYAVVVDDDVVFLAYSRAAPGRWVFRRYRHTDDTFRDAVPQPLVGAASPAADLHASTGPAGGTLWVAYEDGGTVRALAFQPADGGIDTTAAFPAGGTGNPFILGVDASTATLFWQQTVAASPAVFFADFTAGTWGAATLVPGSTQEADPCAVRDGDGRTWLFTTGPGPVGAGTDLFLRTRDPATGDWSASRRVVSSRGADQLPHALFQAGQGIWLLWMSNRLGNFDLFAKRIVTAL